MSNRDNGSKLLDLLCRRYRIPRDEIILINMPWYAREDNAWSCYPAWKRNISFISAIFVLMLMSLAMSGVFGPDNRIFTFILCIFLSLLFIIYNYSRIFAWTSFLRNPDKYHILIMNIPDEDYNFTLIHEFVHIKNRINGTEAPSDSDFDCLRYLEPYTNAEAGIIYKEIFGKNPDTRIIPTGLMSDIKILSSMIKFT